MVDEVLKEAGLTLTDLDASHLVAVPAALRVCASVSVSHKA
ncbi:hypothetical protein JCM19233_3158 [Vibrio astriarenae]|nr:hypothetical protein JCM19233_3158 [Vibrio sp. C7]